MMAAVKIHDHDLSQCPEFDGIIFSKNTILITIKIFIPIYLQHALSNHAISIDTGALF